MYHAVFEINLTIFLSPILTSLLRIHVKLHMLATVLIYILTTVTINPCSLAQYSTKLTC